MSFLLKTLDFINAPNMIRTRGLLVRSQTLYPAELSAHIAFATVLSISDTTHFVNRFFQFFAIIFTIYTFQVFSMPIPPDPHTLQS